MNICFGSEIHFVIPNSFYIAVYIKRKRNSVRWYIRGKINDHTVFLQLPNKQTRIFRFGYPFTSSFSRFNSMKTCTKKRRVGTHSKKIAMSLTTVHVKTARETEKIQADVFSAWRERRIQPIGSLRLYIQCSTIDLPNINNRLLKSFVCPWHCVYVWWN